MMRKTFVGLGLGALLAFPAAVSAQSELAIMKMGRASLVSPPTANNVLGTGATHSFGPASEYTNNDRPVELKALARALRYDAHLVFEYVHNKIEIDPTFGLKKGALGAHIDKSGTTFDQAHLMVELLKASDVNGGTSYNPSYKYGTLTMTLKEAAEWLGLRYYSSGAATHDQTAVENALARGGVPATVSSSNVVVAHVWVSTSIGDFDPSFKSHKFIEGIDLKAGMGYGGASAVINAATPTVQTGTESGAPTIRNFDAAGLESTLNTYATNLVNEIKNTRASASLEEITGGTEIIETNNTAAGLDSDYAANTTWDAVPDQFRTTFQVEVVESIGIIDHIFYVDEIYGRRLTFFAGGSLTGVDTNPATDGYIELRVDDIAIASFAYNSDRGIAEIYDVRLSVNHPYAAESGNYMDQQYLRKSAGLGLGMTIAHGWGDVSVDMMTKLTGERLGDQEVTGAASCTSSSEGRGGGAVSSQVKNEDRTKTQLAYGWLSQFSRMLELQSQLSQSIGLHHHSFGLVTSAAEWKDICEGNTAPGTNMVITTTQDAQQIDIVSGVSIVNRLAESDEEVATERAVALNAATLEGSVFEQFLDKVESTSTTTRFDWANTHRNSANFLYMDQVDYNGGAQAVIDGEFFDQAVEAKLEEYLADGYMILTSEKGYLGPGYENGPPKQQASIFAHSPSWARGGAFVAYHPITGDIAHIVMSGVHQSKGGGAARDQENNEQFDASKVADILADDFEDRTNLHGVSLANGDLSFTASPDVSIGNGGFPYELAFTRTFNAGSGKSQGLGSGWAHNWDINLSVSGSGMEAMGVSSAINATPSLINMIVTQDLFKGDLSQTSATVERLLVPHFVANWWRKALTQNTVSVRQGTSSTTFVRVPSSSGDQWMPPMGSNATLVVSGQRMVKTQIGDPDVTLDPSCAIRAELPVDSERWNFEVPGFLGRNLAFTVTDGEGNVQTFRHKDILAGRPALADGDTCQDNGLDTRDDWPNAPGYLLTDWDMASGVEIDLTYSNSRLVNVQNNFAGSLDFGWQIDSGDSTEARLVSVTATAPLGGQPPVTHTASFTYMDQGKKDRRHASLGGFEVPSAEHQNQPVLVSAATPTGRVTEYKYVGNDINTAHYDPAARNDWFPRLLEVIDPNNMAKPSADRHAALRITYDQVWNSQAFLDATALLDEKLGASEPRGSWQFFIAEGHRGERQDPLGGLLTAYYDGKGRLVEQIDELGNAVISEYDLLGRVIKRIAPEGNSINFSYQNIWGRQFNVAALTRYDKSDANPRTASGAYGDAACPNKPTAVTGFNGNTTTLEYNTFCRITRALQPLVLDGVSQTTKQPEWLFTYNVFGQPLNITEPTGMVTRNTYNAATGALTSAAIDFGGPNEAATSFTYTAFGDTLTTDGPRTDVSDIAIIEYNADRQATAAIDALGVRTELTLDANGNVTQSVAAVGTVEEQSTSMTYTPTGQELCTTSPDGAVTCNEYDDADRLLMVTDPVGRKTRFTYDVAGQLLVEIRAFGSPLQQDYATYSYSQNGQQLNVTDANGNLTDYMYDGFDRLIKTQFPSKSTTGQSNASDYEAFTYDPNGNVLTKRTRANDIITNAYDALDRITQKSPGADKAVAYKYDLAGRQRDVRYTDNSYVMTYAYDSAGRLTMVNDAGRMVSYKYDPASNRIEVRWPDNFFASYFYDDLNRVTAITENGQDPMTGYLAAFAYDALSRRTSMMMGNGTVTTYAYEADSALDTLTHNLTGTADDVTYAFNYNMANQVTAKGLSNQTYQWNAPFDKAETAVPNGLNQLETVSQGGLVFNLDYDDNGSLTGDGTWSYTYDVENRLTNATGPGVAAVYEYDPLGRRSKKSGTGVATEIYLSDGVEEIGDYAANGTTILRRYVHGPGIDEPIVMYTGSGTATKSYYHQNWQGSVVAMTNSTGTATDVYVYSPYGEVDDPTGNPFRYTGRRIDPETGLYYYRARYMSPILGRFLQTDPIGYGDGLNWYAYVGNDPVNAIDPTGTIGRGSGFSDEEWKKFDNAQKRAAKAATKKADKLRKKANKLRNKKNAKQKHLDKANEIEQTAGNLEGVANILNDDGSQGFFADALSGTAFLALPGTSSTGLAAARINGKRINVNMGHNFFLSASAQKKSGIEFPSNTLERVLIHEPLHLLGLRDQTFNGQLAYKNGTLVQRGAFSALKKNDPKRAAINPDHIVDYVY